MKKKVKNFPKFDPKRYVKLSDLAKELKADYRSIFTKQKRLGLFATKCDIDGRDVVCFKNETADKIRKSTAPFIGKNQIQIQDIEKKLKVARPDMLQVLNKLKITPEKRRQVNVKVPRSVLVVRKNAVNKIKAAVKTLLK